MNVEFRRLSGIPCYTLLNILICIIIFPVQWLGYSQDYANLEHLLTATNGLCSNTDTWPCKWHITIISGIARMFLIAPHLIHITIRIVQ